MTSARGNAGSGTHQFARRTLLAYDTPGASSMVPVPVGVPAIRGAPFASRSPRVGKASTEQAVAAASSTSVTREPAAPSTRPCEALRSAAVHGAPDADV